MYNVNGNPITLALVNQLIQSRVEKRAYAEPLEEIKDESLTVINLSLRNVLSDNSYLPQEMIDDLIISTQYYYQVETFKGNSQYDNVVLVIPQTNAFNIYVIDINANKLITKTFLIAVKAKTDVFIDSEITKSQWLETAGRLTHMPVIQYNDQLIYSYMVLFHLVFFTKLIGVGTLDEVVSSLKALLLNSEVTLQLNITDTIKLYGDVESNGTLHLYIRQIGTPDTFWKRTASLTQLLGHQ